MTNVTFFEWSVVTLQEADVEVLVKSEDDFSPYEQISVTDLVYGLFIHLTE